MKGLSLFSGIGGFDLGFQRAGIEITAMCEIDRRCREVLSRQFPNTPIHEDVREVNYERGSVDIVFGGFPCQDLSRAGRRLGFSGERSSLWFEFARVIGGTRPKWVVIENVPGIFSSDGGRDLTTVIRWLADHGYGVGWRVLDSQGFGLAQRRKRVFIIGSLGNPSGCTVLLDPGSLSGVLKQAGKNRKNNSSEFTKSSENKGDWSNVDRILWEATHIENPVRISANQYVSPTLQARMGTGGNNTPMLGVRKLTVLECERLQGFPEGWTEGSPLAQRYKQLGNAVSVAVADCFGRRIMEKEYGE